MSSYVNEGDGGYSTPIPRSTATSGVGAPLVVLDQYTTSHQLAADEQYIVSSCSQAASVTLPPATGSGRTHIIVNRGSSDLTLVARDSENIAGQSSLVLRAGTSATVLDHLIYHWSVAASAGIAEPLFLRHTILPGGSDPGVTLTGWQDQTLALSATGTITVALPPATVPGQRVTVYTVSNSCSWTDAITIQASGSDLVGSYAATTIKIWVPLGRLTLQSDGVGRWSIVERSPKIWYTRWLSGTTFVTEPDAVWYRFQLVGGGGGGGNAGLQGGITYHGGGGGGSGAWGWWEGAIAPNTSLTITVGVRGAGKSAGADSDGGTGGSSSVGSLVTANGGAGGTRGSNGGSGGLGGALQSISSINAVGHPQMLVTSFTFAIPSAMRLGGGNGGTGAGNGSNGGELSPAWFAAGAGGVSTNCSNGGGGAASPFGAGGSGGYRDGTDTIIAGAAATGYGAGGGGAALKTIDGTPGDSGAGTQGFVEVWVFF